MIPPPLPIDEPARLDALRTLNILDTPAEERLDRFTRLAKRLFGVPIVLISLVDEDRQWFKSSQGLNVCETSRDVSFCAHAILRDEIMVVPDALLDERFHDNPLVTGDPKIRFYAGCPLTVPNGSKIGTLCLIDAKPRAIDLADLALLRDLAYLAEQEIAYAQRATMDDLTQLSNRRGFVVLAQHALNLCARRLELPASLLFFDLEDFHAINDRYGLDEGDRALVAFASLILNTFRDSDVVGRYGGDEFVVLFTNCTEADSKAALERLQAAVDGHNRKNPLGYEIRFNVGLVPYEPTRHSSIETMLSHGDSLMHQRKRQVQVA
jgi:diguanylate cyclase (GGDEF)-like protein